MKINNGFTLVEVLVASSIFVIVIMTVYSAFHGGILGYRNIEKAIDIHQSAMHILERINTDLRNSFAYSQAETKFKGEGDIISFLALVDRFNGDNIIQDYAFISYDLQGGRIMRQCRRNQESLNVRSEIAPEELASNVQELSFSYASAGSKQGSMEWTDSWSDPRVLPPAVKIKLILKDKTSREFERTIFLPHG